MTATEWQAILSYSFAPGTAIFFRYRTQQQGGITQQIQYRLEMDYTI